MQKTKHQKNAKPEVGLSGFVKTIMNVQKKRASKCKTQSGFPQASSTQSYKCKKHTAKNY